jgi:hypothetical protein
VLYYYRPKDTSGINNKTVKTRPWQTGRKNGTSGTIGWGVAKLYRQVQNIRIYEYGNAMYWYTNILKPLL